MTERVMSTAKIRQEASFLSVCLHIASLAPEELKFSWYIIYY